MADDPLPDPNPGMVDPRTIQPGPEAIPFEPDAPPTGTPGLDPDDGPTPPPTDPPADEATGLTDPRAGIPGLG